MKAVILKIYGITETKLVHTLGSSYGSEEVANQQAQELIVKGCSSGFFFGSTRCMASSPVARSSGIDIQLHHKTDKSKNHPNHHASDTNPPSQDWRPSKKNRQQQTRVQSKINGAASQPNKKRPEYKSDCTHMGSNQNPVKEHKNLAPGGQNKARKACKY